jgi:hypothetical protein
VVIAKSHPISRHKTARLHQDTTLASLAAEVATEIHIVAIIADTVHAAVIVAVTATIAVAATTVHVVAAAVAVAHVEVAAVDTALAAEAQAVVAVEAVSEVADKTSPLPYTLKIFLKNYYNETLHSIYNSFDISYHTSYGTGDIRKRKHSYTGP